MTAPTASSRPVSSSRTPRRRPGPLTRLRGFAASVVLIATTVGLPLVLTKAGGSPLPHHMPNLTRGDDGSFAVGLLLTIAWLAWASYLLACAVETIALVRHRPARRVPGLRWMHEAAAGLLTTAALALPAISQPAFAITSAHPTAVAVPAAAHASAAYPDEPHAAAASIQASAPDIEQASAGHRIYVVPEPEHGVHATLWSISARELGNPLRWKEIFQLNKGRIQPDGERFTDPSLIKPGWRLHLPTVAAPQTARIQHQPPLPRPPRPTHTNSRTSHPSRDVGRAPAAANDAVRTPTDDGPSAEHPTSATPPPERHDSPQPADASRHDDLPWLAVSGAILAVGLLASLSQWRAYQRHHRRPGERAVPPSSMARQAERRLRLAADPDIAATLTAALSALAAQAVEAGTWPEIANIELAGDEVYLHLARPFPMSTDAPFVSVRDGTAYRYQPGASIEGEAGSLLPAVVTIGERDGRRLLVDLESLPATRIDADADTAAALLRHIAVELATAPWAAAVAVTLVGMPAGLAAINPARVRCLDTVDEPFINALDVHTTHRADSTVILHARTDPECCDVAVHVVLIGPDVQITDPALYGRLVALADGRAVTVLTTNGDLPVTSTLTLDAEATLTLPAIEGTVTAVGLDDALATAIGELVDNAQDLTPTPPLATTIVDQPPPPPSEDVSDEHASTAPAHSDEQIPTPAPGTSRDPLTDRVHRYLSYDETVPRVGVIGEVMVNAVGPIESKRAGVTTELIAFLATHPRGVSAVELDSALWPDHPPSPSRRAKSLSYARRWLGTTADGHERIPRVDSHPRIQLSDDVLCDWTLFQQLTTRAHTNDDAGSRISDLGLALQLVRGQPFAFLPPRRYAWLADDQLEEEITAAVGDAACELAEHLLAAGDAAAAREAIRVGQTVDRYNEALWQLRLRADHALGGAMKVRASVVEMENTLDVADIGDLSPSLAAVVDHLLPRRGQRAG